jgi:hypothetical protein
MFIWATPAWWKHSREVSAVESEEQAFPLGLMPVLKDLLDPLLLRKSILLKLTNIGNLSLHSLYDHMIMQLQIRK